MSITNLYIQTAFVIGVFLFLRFLYMKYVEQEALPPKEFAKDAGLCGISTILGYYLYKNFYSVLDGISENSPPIFTENPNF